MQQAIGAITNTYIYIPPHLSNCVGKFSLVPRLSGRRERI